MNRPLFVRILQSNIWLKNTGNLSNTFAILRFSHLQPLVAYSARYYSSESDHNGQEKDNPSTLDYRFYDGLYFDGNIPRNRIAQKWSKASGPGGMNINANPTKAEIRFELSEADWIPIRVRERMSQKYQNCMNNKGEFHLTSMRTRSSVENMEDCYDKLMGMLQEVSEDLIRERRREYISPEYTQELEIRKKRAEQIRLSEKKRNSDKKKARRNIF